MLYPLCGWQKLSFNHACALNARKTRKRAMIRWTQKRNSRTRSAILVRLDPCNMKVMESGEIQGQ